MLLAEPEPTRADVKFSLAGLPVRVHPGFWIGTLLLGWDASRGPGGGIEGLAWWILIVFVAILAHELGHALTARAFGATNTRIVLYWMGGLAISDGGLSRGRRVVELLMGPGAGFLLFGAVWLAVQAAGGPEQLSLKKLIAYEQLKWVCLAWGFVNLLPIYPLDGGQIAAEGFVARKGPADGLIATLRLTCVTAAITSGVFGWLWWTNRMSGMAAFFFLIMAISAGVALARIRRQLLEGGAGFPDDDLMPHERAEWEKDPDWWKGK